jgi:diacylglycerol kinase
VDLLASVAVIILALLLGTSKIETILLAFAIGITLAAELFNSAIEKAVDFTGTEFHPSAKLAKDISAGAVLVTAITAVIVGLIIFVPKLLLIFS